MRPKIPNPKEVKNFFEKANLETKQEVISSLFDMAGTYTIPYPRNQHELVLHTLIFPPKELTLGYWMEKYKTAKWSSRLGEVEERFPHLVERVPTKFVNRFGHAGRYTVYKPLLTIEEYIDIYLKMREKCI